MRCPLDPAAECVSMIAPSLVVATGLFWARMLTSPPVAEAAMDNGIDVAEILVPKAARKPRPPQGQGYPFNDASPEGLAHAQRHQTPQADTQRWRRLTLGGVG